MSRRRQLDTKKRDGKKRQRGAAMVETALVFLVTLSMIIFIMDMGRVLLTQQVIADRAQAGVRMAVVNNWDATEVANYVAYGSTTTPESGSSTPGLMGIAASEVTLTTYADTGIGDARYKVKVRCVPFFTFIPSLAGSFHAPTVVATAPVQSLGATN